MRWWMWPTVLSLDAPAVAVVWQWQLAGVVGRAPTWPEAAVLAASVWLAYTGDRWIEGLRLRPGQVRTRRHRFHQQHRWSIVSVSAVVLAADLWLALATLRPVAVLAGLVLTVAVLTYLLSHQFVHRHHPWRVPKEVVAAVLLGAGVGLFPLLSPGVDASRLAAPLGLFVLLAFANCVLISDWERHVDLSHGQTSLALQSELGAGMGRAAVWLAGLGALWLWLAGPAAAAQAAIAAAASAIGLAVVNAAQPRLGPAAARVLSDVALLTPVVAIARAWITA